MSDDAATGIENLSQETRTFSPPTEFVQNAVARPSIYEEAERDHLAFWRSRASLLSWETPFTETLDWSDPPFARWFADGTLNVAYNCVDRHVESGHGDQAAILAEYEDGTDATYTYAQVKDEISRMANVLTDLGVKTGDRVAIYLPMIPEAAFAMLACARIGAPHSVVFGGFSADALRSRIEDAEARVVITADGQNRRGKQLPLKPAVDEALATGGDSVEKVLVVRRTGGDVEWNEGRDVWWHEAREDASAEHEPVWVEAEHPLFILYTSGTTGNPKGIIHTTGGYLTQAAYTHRNVFDIKPSTDVYWCTADVGWVTGHTYVVYGPMAN
ncbi:MAG: AMP-binding protein, partial [Brachybacterium sp.]|nr:AMP-binding protein [Brachybacterium sp.]